MLTKHQEEVVDSIIESINQGEKNILLKGSAGVGKTFAVQYLIEKFRFKQDNKRRGLVYITAPTNKAVAVLEEKSKDFEKIIYEERKKSGIYVDKLWERDFKVFKTIHSALFLKRKINDKTGEITFVPEYNPDKEVPFQNADLIIVDEASMLESKILYYLEGPEFEDIPKIYLGDDKQLNPVGEEDSPIFIRNFIYDNQEASGSKKPFIEFKLNEETTVLHYIKRYAEFELTEIIRQGEGSPIIDLSRNLSWLRFRRSNNLNSEGEGYEFTKDFNTCLNMIIKDPKNVRYLAWTNVEVNRVNAIIRQRIYIYPKKLHLGEIVVVGQAYNGITGGTYTTNSELEIKELEIFREDFVVWAIYDPQPNEKVSNIIHKIGDKNYGKARQKLVFKLSYYLINGDVMVIHEDSEKDFYAASKKLKEFTKMGMSWKTWFVFTEQFLKFHYQYALTVHKSQGSTYSKAIMNLVDINRNKNVKEHLRLCYTAITRASKNVYLYEYNPKT